MINVLKADPTNTYFLCRLYNYIKSSEKEYAHIELDTVLECRDNVLIAANDIILTGGIFGIMMCRRVNISDIESEALSFHCQPYNIAYSIDAICINHPFTTNDERIAIFKSMMEINAASKKDAFILIRLPQSYKDLLEDTLIEMGCYLSKEINNGIYTFIKPPINI